MRLSLNRSGYVTEPFAPVPRTRKFCGETEEHVDASTVFLRKQMEIEVTENTFIRNPEHAIDQFNKLAQLGVSIAIDDFGTGYSSLAYLQRFSIHTLKIDQSFVKEIHWESTHSPIILAIISIARGLGLNVVAEGVETEIQARYLERAGCKIMQGYLYHPPIPKSTLIQKLVQLESEQLEKSFEQAGAK